MNASLSRDWVYPPVVRTALLMFRLLRFRFDVRGVDNIPSTGAAVLASNHVSYLDFMFVGFAAHRRGRRLVRFLAKRAVFAHPVGGPLMRGMRHIPVDRSAGADAYVAAVDALRRGELVGVFPEQTIARSFVPRPMKTGAARMAIEAGVPIVPVAVWGGQRVWTVGRRAELHTRVPISVWVDEPLQPQPGESAADLTARLQARLRDLVDEVIAAYPDRGLGEFWWPAHLGGGAPSPDDAAAAEHASISGRRRT